MKSCGLGPSINVLPLYASLQNYSISIIYVVYGRSLYIYHDCIAATAMQNVAMFLRSVPNWEIVEPLTDIGELPGVLQLNSLPVLNL